MDGNGLNEYAILLYKSGDATEALKYWKTAAEMNNPNANYCLGLFSIKNGDYQKAVVWFEKAKKAGHKNADIQINKIINGEMVYSDIEKIIAPNTSVPALDFPKITLGNIEWYVVKENRDKKMCLSKDIIDIRKFHNTDENVVWGNSDIRLWLNTSFLSMFSTTEKHHIQDAEVVNELNSKYKTGKLEITKDKIFLLSSEEVREIFEGCSSNVYQDDLLRVGEHDWKRMAFVNIGNQRLQELSAETGMDYSKINGKSLGWWLRTSGSATNRAVRVNCNGSLRLHGREVNRNLVGVRPALWLGE